MTGGKGAGPAGEGAGGGGGGTGRETWLRVANTQHNIQTLYSRAVPLKPR